MLRKTLAIGVFIGAVAAADYVWKFIFKAYSTHHTESAPVQGAASVIS